MRKGVDGLTLSAEFQDLAAEAGPLRTEKHDRLRKKDTNYWDKHGNPYAQRPPNFERDQIGGEIVFALLAGLPTPTLQTLVGDYRCGLEPCVFHFGDGSCFDVKTSDGHCLHLEGWLADADCHHQHDLYVQMTGVFPTYVYGGWARHDELVWWANWCRHGAKPGYYRLLRSRLHDEW